MIRRLDVFVVLASGERVYFDRKADAEVTEPLFRTSISEFPCLLRGDQTPWAEANKFLLESVCQNLTESVLTQKSVANDLLRFLRFLESEQIDFKQVTARKPLLPFYRFRFELKNQVEAGELSGNTANRCLGRVTAFYKWAHEVGLLVAEAVPDERVRTNYRRLATPPTNCTSEDHQLTDGQRLRPLTVDEQDQLLHALDRSKNVEMTMIFKTAMLTGLRVQSILTLKRSIFEALDNDSERFIPVALGRGTSTDTKFNKRLVAYFPRALLERLQTYCASARSERRREKASYSPFAEYIFLSNRGTPYYATMQDRTRLGSDCTAEGEAVRAYLRTYLIPSIGFKFRFHDLRATFAMNLVDAQMALVEQKKITLHQARIYVKDRLGQESIEVTDRYLNFRHSVDYAKTIQRDFEERILSPV